uniref:ADP-ribosylation factor-like protein 2-binding protein n=1 Tax=Eutreptiella gymnastica TaxID=73025 RepID=A0A7S4LP33_9EUGL
MKADSSSHGTIIKHDFEDDTDMDETEFVFASNECSPEDEMFDIIIGKIEELIMDEEFNAKQQTFFAENCVHFTDDEENKFIYTEIHNKYVAEIEAHIDAYLKEEVPGYDPEQFFTMLRNREDEVVGDIWDLLTSFTDFAVFKDLMLSYRSQQKQKLNMGDYLDTEPDLTVLGRSPTKGGPPRGHF